MSQPAGDRSKIYEQVEISIKLFFCFKQTLTADV
jgi:hypothetical protein